MSPVEFHLVPTPGAKPEFLAAIQPIPNKDDNRPPEIWQSIASRNKVIILEGYTRDAWALDTATKWVSLQVKSIDGRQKLPGFVKYLRERKKTCFGRFVMDMATSSTDNGNGNDNSNNITCTTFVWVISHKQTSSSHLSCRIAPIHSIPKCPLRPKSSIPTTRKPAAATATLTSSAAASSTTKIKPKKKGFGLLGNLVGAQRRTNHQVVTSNTATQSAAAAAAAAAGKNNSNHLVEETGDGKVAVPLATSGQVLADFRHEMEQKMLDFDIAPDVSMNIEVKLSDHTKKVQEADKGKITMEVLKYIVYEQAEEVNEEWIAHKEYSEFTDEITVAIYKDAEDAPPEVLEELNQAEIPEEMKAQQKMIEQKRRQQEMNALRIQEALQRQALRKIANTSGGDDNNGEGAGGFSVLNTEKRDLRTIEEIQQDTKRRRME